MRRVVLLVVLMLSACSEERPLVVGRANMLTPRTAADSPLYAQYPELDQRIEQLDPKNGRRTATLYPDLWQPDVRAVRDFVVDRSSLYALLASEHGTDERLLYIVDVDKGALLGRLELSDAPRRLAWSAEGQLLVGHFGAKAGGRPGRLSVVDPQQHQLLTYIDLAGACISMVATPGRAFVLERTVRGIGAEALAVIYRLAEVDLNRAAVTRRLDLPAGARQVVVGPTGLLYVSHASPSGLHATDGTISVIDPRSFTVMGRIRMDMVVRHMVSTSDWLVLNMLSRSGETWFSVVLADHQVLFDFRFGELTSPELAVIDGIAYVPQRGEAKLVRVDVQRRRVLSALDLGRNEGVRDRPGILRTVMHAR